MARLVELLHRYDQVVTEVLQKIEQEASVSAEEYDRSTFQSALRALDRHFLHELALEEAGLDPERIQLWLSAETACPHGSVGQAVIQFLLQIVRLKRSARESFLPVRPPAPIKRRREKRPARRFKYPHGVTEKTLFPSLSGWARAVPPATSRRIVEKAVPSMTVGELLAQFNEAGELQIDGLSDKEKQQVVRKLRRLGFNGPLG